jgi:hypothetical protein
MLQRKDKMVKEGESGSFEVYAEGWATKDDYGMLR